MNKKYSLISKILAISVSSLGVMVFMGWLFDISILKSVVPGVVSMKVNTALYFILSGFTLWILNEEKQNSLKKMCSIVFPSIMILIGLLTLGEYLFEINFGIDEFLFKEETRATATSDPGRMSPITAFCFILSGISLMLLYKNKAFQMFQLLSLAVFALALLTLIGYGYAVNDFQGGMASFTKMAIHTSVAFVFLSVGMLFSKSDKGIMYIFTNDGIAGITTRKLLPVIIFTPLILGWLRLIGQQAGYYDTEFGVALFSFTTILILVVVVFGISGTLLAIDRKRKEAEEQLNEYRHFFNINHDLCGIANTEGYFEFINANFAKILGYTEKEFCETAFIELIHPDDIPATVQEYEKLKSGALVINFVNRYRKKDGSYLYLDWNATPNPATQKLYCVARDISERKKAEEMLELTQFAVDNFGDAIFWITPDARIVKVNEAACSMLGYSQAELLQFSIPDIDPNYNAELWPNHFAELRQKGSLFFETYQQGKDGQLIPVEVTANYINFDNKEFNCASVRDITKRKKAEEELQAVNKELEAFSYSVSHDLRAPLRAINGFSKILYEDYASKLDAEGIGMLNIIRDNSKKMGELIDALLAFSKLGRREISVSEINMTELVATVREEEMRGQSDKTEFIINELPAATGDIVLIKQVWINLVSNAIKYSQHIPKARIEIGSYYKENLIVYYVKDNGAGFDMQYYDKLFGVFQRLHSQEEFIGTGIGLSIAEKVINRHGGSVWAESKLNEGSCFYFSLPNINL